MPYACRLGDPANHPGQITTAAQHTYLAGRLAARKGDTFHCEDPDHAGDYPITSGSDIVRIEGAPAAREGDTAACGAVLRATQTVVDLR